MKSIFSLSIAFTWLAAGSFTLAGTIDYGSRTSSSFDFLEINEVSSWNTYLGGNATNPVASPILLGNTLTFSPFTSLQVSTASATNSPGQASDHASTIFGFKVRAKTDQTIKQLKLDISGNYDLFSVNLGGSVPSMAIVDIGAKLELKLFGVNGSPYGPATTKQFNVVINPSSVTASAGGTQIVSSPDGFWTGTWSGAVVNGVFSQDLATIFDIPSMDITELGVSFTPDLDAFRSISDQNSASVFLTNANFAVIPEPSTSALASVGLLALLRRRRRS